jgi:hypothetical protein
MGLLYSQVCGVICSFSNCSAWTTRRSRFCRLRRSRPPLRITFGNPRLLSLFLRSRFYSILPEAELIASAISERRHGDIISQSSAFNTTLDFRLACEGAGVSFIDRKFSSFPSMDPPSTAVGLDGGEIETVNVSAATTGRPLKRSAVPTEEMNEVLDIAAPPPHRRKASSFRWNTSTRFATAAGRSSGMNHQGRSVDRLRLASARRGSSESVTGLRRRNGDRVRSHRRFAPGSVVGRRREH